MSASSTNRMASALCTTQLMQYKGSWSASGCHGTVVALVGAFCSATGCDHGKQSTNGKCSDMSCNRCKDLKCAREWNAIESDWLHPVQQKRTGRGIYWATEQEHATREQLMETMCQEMNEFHIHNNHVLFHKTQMRNLMSNFATDEIIVKADFIQNIVHSRGHETSQSYYRKC
jgi:hypothetical protein